MSTSPGLATVYLGLGGNLGDREAAIRTALAHLGAVPGLKVRRVSALRDTAAVGGPPGQPDHLNGVAELQCALPLPALLAICKQLEAEAGRDFTAERNGPRPLDLDILAAGRPGGGPAPLDVVVDTRDLTVPHPRLRERAFVREPLVELGVDPDALPNLELARTVRDPVDLAATCRGWRRGDCVVGVVPTMGALHAGHRALMERARAECDRVVATVFVNPKQFDVAADLDAYPRTLEQDRALCREVGVDVVFAPAVHAMYPTGFASEIAVGAEGEGMEGGARAGHFSGVATVVAKLLNLTQADRAYFGEKDAQQLAVVRRAVTDLEIQAEVVGCPIVREPDGLARSSRNARLGPRDRAAAAVVHRALRAARDAFVAGERDPAALLAAARAELDAEPLGTVDYLELRAEGDLGVLAAGRALDDGGARMLVAVRFDTDSECATRLLDNISLSRAPQ